MNTKKYLVFLGLLGVMLVGVSSLVLAENMMDNHEERSKKAMMGEHDGPEMKVEIGPRGNAILRGVIKTVGTNSLTVTSWGGDWIINISSTTKLMPGSDMTQFKAGDFVGVQGKVNTTALWTLEATLVRDWTVRKDAQENKQEIKELKKASDPRNWEGTSSAVNTTANSLTLTIDGTAYTVNIVAGAKIVNRNYATILLSDIQNGHKVRVWGTVSGTVITGYIIRDTSLPL